MVDLRQYPDQAEALLGSSIIKLVPEISIWRADQDLVNLFLASVKDGVTVNLKKLTIYEVSGLANIEPGLFSSAAMKLRTLDARLSYPQAAAIITRLVDTGDSSLRQLSFLVDGAHAIIKLVTSGSMLCEFLSADKVMALISRICQAPVLRLTKLYLHYSDLSLIPPEVMVGAIQRLERVEFFRGRITSEQATAILNMAKEDRLGKIKWIRFFRVDGMRFVSPLLVQEAKLNKKLKWYC